MRLEAKKAMAVRWGGEREGEEAARRITVKLIDAVVLADNAGGW